MANYIKPRYYLKNKQPKNVFFLNSGYALFEKELVNK